MTWQDGSTTPSVPLTLVMRAELVPCHTDTVLSRTYASSAASVPFASMSAYVPYGSRMKLAESDFDSAMRVIALMACFIVSTSYSVLKSPGSMSGASQADEDVIVMLPYDDGVLTSVIVLKYFPVSGAGWVADVYWFCKQV
jgi:hypothetical protein